MVIRYRLAPGRDGQHGKKVIVGFEVYAKSIEAANRNETGLPADINNPLNGMELRMSPNSTAMDKYPDSSYVPDDEEWEDENAQLTVPFTYSVYFREDDRLEWGNRWDMYFVNQEDSNKIHWLAIVNSLIISGLLTAVVAVILTRTVYGDIKGYRETRLEEGKIKLRRNKKVKSPRRSGDKSTGLLDQMDDDGSPDLSSDDEPLEDITGWKLVHGDVFRPPMHGDILAPLVGSGMQLVIVALGLLLMSCFGILNPSLRGGFISAGIAFFVLAGAVSGYFSGRVYKTFGGQMWKKNVIVTGVLVPGLIFSTMFFLNFFVWAQASSTAIPFGTLVGLLALWLLIQLPLVYVGSWYGFVIVGAWDHPVKPNAVPRQIPQQTWYRTGVQSVLAAGLIPFAVMFIELLFVFKSLWQDKSGYYYVFGFLAVVSVILMITVIEVTIVATYLQLCSEVSSASANYNS